MGRKSKGETVKVLLQLPVDVAAEIKKRAAEASVPGRKVSQSDIVTMAVRNQTVAHFPPAVPGQDSWGVTNAQSVNDPASGVRVEIPRSRQFKRGPRQKGDKNR